MPLKTHISKSKCNKRLTSLSSFNRNYRLSRFCFIRSFHRTMNGT